MNVIIAMIDQNGLNWIGIENPFCNTTSSMDEHFIAILNKSLTIIIIASAADKINVNITIASSRAISASLLMRTQNVLCLVPESSKIIRYAVFVLVHQMPKLLHQDVHCSHNDYLTMSDFPKSLKCKSN